MSASDIKATIKATESDEVIRKKVIPTPEVGSDQPESDKDRSPIDEETKRDAPVDPLSDDNDTDESETIRQPVLPNEPS